MKREQIYKGIIMQLDIVSGGSNSKAVVFQLPEDFLF